MRRDAECEVFECKHNGGGECTILRMNGRKIGTKKMLCAFYDRDTEYTCASCRFCEATRVLYCREQEYLIPFAKLPACPSYKPV